MDTADFLSKLTNKSRSSIVDFLRLAPNKYRVYTIPKRSYGYRTIAHPTANLKFLQRTFSENFAFPTHAAAQAYVSGKGIKSNATQHKNNCYLLKLDLEDFFNSIKPDLFWGVWNKAFQELPSPASKEMLEQLLFWRPSRRIGHTLVLSVGAPSSPAVSNFCMYFFDVAITNICELLNVKYTRYADDLTFSTNQKDILFELPALIESTLKEEFSLQLNLNKKKTKFSSKAHNRHVTGVTITNDSTLSLGRSRKRYIKHLVHRATLKQLNIDELNHLIGLLSFAHDIEPDFLTRLDTKYGDGTIQRIRSLI